MEAPEPEAAPISMGDWESAMLDQAASEASAAAEAGIAPMATQAAEEDPWASALAEQAASEAAAPAAPTMAPSAFSPPSAGSGLSSLFENFDRAETPPPVQTKNGLEFIMDIPVTVTVELGRTRIPVKVLLQLAQGSVVELEGLAGEPLDVLANGTLIAQGEVVVVNDKFGIRLTDVVTPMERMKRLRR